VADRLLDLQNVTMAFGGLTVVVTPLVALMDDQVAAATSRGIAAGALHAGMTPEARPGVRPPLPAGPPA